MHWALIKEGRTNVSEALSIRLDGQRRCAFRLNGLQLEFHPNNTTEVWGKTTGVSRRQQVPTEWAEGLAQGAEHLQC